MTVEMTRVSPVDAARDFGVNYYTRAYERGMTVSQLLEEDDPTDQYPAEERDLDAFERVLMATGIITTSDPATGVRATSYEEATKTKAKRAVFHEFCTRVYRQATKPASMTPATRALILSGDSPVNTIANMYADDTTIRAKKLVPPIPLDLLLARSEGIKGQDYRSLYIVDDLGTDANRLKRVMEGARIPATTLVTGEHVMQIHKFGRMLRATYEQLRRQRVDRIAFVISRMALQAQVDKVALVLNTVINGDGNANTSSTVLAQTALDPGSSAGTATLKAWLTFKARFTNAYIARRGAGAGGGAASGPAPAGQHRQRHPAHAHARQRPREHAQHREPLQRRRRLRHDGGRAGAQDRRLGQHPDRRGDLGDRRHHLRGRELHREPDGGDDHDRERRLRHQRR
jgi:hypothetical protein